mmetsp:Transcript_5819/g.18026  ORF Transcript_5819/g.18026 Transcript_5819/m.18026 type:complete len:146 (+) Transcript_5819:72-509(+)
MVDLRHLASLLAILKALHCEAGCTGGDLASCHCLLECPVFASAPGRCDVSNVQSLVSGVVHDVIAKPGSVSECEAMDCIVKCGKRLGCLSNAIKLKCRKLKWQHGRCNIDCSAAHRRVAGLGRMPLLIAATVVAATVGHETLGSW